MTSDLLFKRIGKNALLVEWPQIISEPIREQIHTFNYTLSTKNIAGITEIIPCYTSVGIYFNPRKTSFETLEKEIKSLTIDKVNKPSQNYKTWEIPVCYAESEEVDMKHLVKHTGLPRKEIIRLHSEKEYRVHMIGFLPGFLYLGGLDERLYCPKKSIPSKKVAAGSVGIGGDQTGIYPIESPGGWHIIGRTKVSFFDPTKDVPCFAKAGDVIRFYPID